MELVVQLPANHPLGTVNVESGKRVGVASAQWRNWMLQMTTFLSHQVCSCDTCYKTVFKGKLSNIRALEIFLKANFICMKLTSLCHTLSG